MELGFGIVRQTVGLILDRDIWDCTDQHVKPYHDVGIKDKWSKYLKINS